MAERKRNGRAQLPPPSETFVKDPERVPEDEDDAEGPGPDHNGRLKALDDLLAEWCQLQDREDAQLKKHILPIREDKAEVKAKAKKDCDIPTEAFNARAAMRRIELKKENDEVVIAFNELLEATPFGKSVDLFAAAERVAAKKKAEAEAAAAKAAAKTKAKETPAEI